MAYRVTVKRAAELTGLSIYTIQRGIKLGCFDFGVSIPTAHRQTIHISPAKLADYLGITVEEVMGVSDVKDENTEV